MIVIDFSGCAISNILSFKADLQNSSDEKITDLARHTIISTILAYKKKYGKKYGEIVIACDGRKYWRKDVFEFYKANRKKNREDSDINWTSLFSALETVKKELSETFPFKVIEIEEAEADDIIAILAKWSQTNDIGESFFDADPKPFMIISADNDFIQLQQYKNVEQWSYMTKKAINATQKEVKTKLLEHIVRGDSGDGVPNLFSRDDCFVNKIRQTPVSKKRLEEFLEVGYEACKNDEERRNWQRNELLVNLDKIPERIETKILDKFNTLKPKTDLMEIMMYFSKNNCRLLLDEVENFK
jgi:hypothetical protein